MIFMKSIGILWIFFVNVHNIQAFNKESIYKKEKHKNIPIARYVPYTADQIKESLDLVYNYFKQNIPTPPAWPNGYTKKKPKPKRKPKKEKRKPKVYNFNLKGRVERNNDLIFKQSDWLRALVKPTPPDNIVIVLLNDNTNNVDTYVQENRDRKDEFDKNLVLINLDDANADEYVNTRFGYDYYDAVSNEETKGRNGIVNVEDDKRSQMSASDLEKVENDQDHIDEVILDLEDYKKNENNKLSARKRFHKFLPKRYFWDNSDVTKLGYFWYNGPQGKFPGPYRVSF